MAGLTTSGLEQLLRGRYDQYIHNPQVGVQVKEYRSQLVTVTGAVRNPVVSQLTGPKTLIDLLAMAGGITERAGGQVHLYRQGPEGRQTYVIDLLALASNPDAGQHACTSWGCHQRPTGRHVLCRWRCGQGAGRMP